VAALAGGPVVLWWAAVPGMLDPRVDGDQGFGLQSFGRDHAICGGEATGSGASLPLVDGSGRRGPSGTKAAIRPASAARRRYSSITVTVSAKKLVT
jgi:hypothetical protein